MEFSFSFSFFAAAGNGMTYACVPNLLVSYVFDCIIWPKSSLLEHYKFVYWDRPATLASNTANQIHFHFVGDECVSQWLFSLKLCLAQHILKCWLESKRQLGISHSMKGQTYGYKIEYSLITNIGRYGLTSTTNKHSSVWTECGYGWTASARARAFKWLLMERRQLKAPKYWLRSLCTNERLKQSINVCYRLWI